MKRELDPVREAELRQVFQAKKAGLGAWGDFIVHIVTDAFSGRSSLVKTEFWAVPPNSRVKEVDSFIRKALYHPTKHYDDPMNQITDLVGVRFVTLLQQDADEVIRFIAEHNAWSPNHDRNFRIEIHDKPTQFDYFANHFLLTAPTDREHGGVGIPAGTCCEVQVRTLLQHAHSELTHDTTYKGVLKENKDVVRRVARGAAMIESTDEIFDLVATRMKDVREPVDVIEGATRTLYEARLPGRLLESPLNEFLLDALLRSAPQDVTEDAIKTYFDDNPGVIEALEAVTDSGPLYRVPAVLLAVYLADARPTYLDDVWPLTDAELDTLKLGVGISSGDY